MRLLWGDQLLNLIMLTFFSILFNPDNNAIENIKNAIKCGIRVVVYLNKVSYYYENLLKTMNVHVIGENINQGLGVAFNEFETYMNAHNLDYYIYFDQDTVVDLDSWREILASYYLHFEDCRVALVNILPSIKKSPNLVISSGSIFSMRNMNSIGLHDKTYFVEGVDYEYCLRLNAEGYKIISFPISGVDHLRLQDGNSIEILGFKFRIRIYGNMRARDFNISHCRLLIKSINLKRYDFFIFFIKSIVFFNFKEMVSRFVGKVFK
jgi:rhamnosyltransferase